MLKQTDKVLTDREPVLLSTYTFDVRQNNSIISAQFSGGTIQTGKLIGVVDRNRVVTMRFTYVTVLNELKSGNDAFPLSISEDTNKISSAWNWLGLKQREEIQVKKDELTSILVALLRKHLN